MAYYSDDYISDAARNLNEASKNFHRGSYNNEIYHLEKAKELIEKAIEKAAIENEFHINYNS